MTVKFVSKGYDTSAKQYSIAYCEINTSEKNVLIGIEEEDIFNIHFDQWSYFCAVVLSKTYDKWVEELNSLFTKPIQLQYINNKSNYCFIDQLITKKENLQVFSSLINLISNLPDINKIENGTDIDYLKKYSGKVFIDKLPPQNGAFGSVRSVTKKLLENNNIAKEIVEIGWLFELALFSGNNDTHGKILFYYRPYNTPIAKRNKLLPETDCFIDEMLKFYDDLLNE